MRTLTRHERRTRRGSVMLFFAMVAVPMMLLASAIGIDVTRIVIAHRQLAVATSSAALAGAWTFDTTSSRRQLDTAKATANAYATYCQNVADVLTVAQPSTGTHPSSADNCRDLSAGVNGAVNGDQLGANVTITGTSTAENAVTVTASADVNDLVLLGFLMSLTDSNARGTSVRISTSSVSYTCNSDTDTGEQQGNCSRPINE